MFTTTWEIHRLRENHHYQTYRHRRPESVKTLRGIHGIYSPKGRPFREGPFSEPTWCAGQQTGGHKSYLLCRKCQKEVLKHINTLVVWSGYLLLSLRVWHLIWIYTVFKRRTYQGSAAQGLTYCWDRQACQSKQCRHELCRMWHLNRINKQILNKSLGKKLFIFKDQCVKAKINKCNVCELRVTC